VDRTIRLWDVETGQTIHALTGHQGSVYELAFAPMADDWPRQRRQDGALWDTVAGKEEGEYTHDADVMGWIFSPTRYAGGLGKQ